MGNHNPLRPDRQVERSVDHLIRAAEMTGEMWARHGYDVNQRIRDHAPFWPGGRTGRLRLILAALKGAQRAGGHS
jgi:hypothetical protein